MLPGVQQALEDRDVKKLIDWYHSQFDSIVADAKKALAEGGVERLNESFNQLQTASHKLAEALYQQAPPPGSETGGAGEQASAAGASSSGGADDNVIDAEYVDVDENK